jgi:hypothetical protein
MRFKRGDFLHIPTVGTYRCICCDDQVAVFSYPDQLIGNMNTFTRSQEDGKRVKVSFDESEEYTKHEDTAHVEN